MKTQNRKAIGLVVLALTVFGLAVQGNVFAHCDSLDGPVVADARAALESKDITPVLKWIRPSNEDEIKAVFKQALEVRTKGEQAKSLADNYFFETLVRIHRAGEGAPYTGLKPAGTTDPAIVAADKAIDEGSVDKLAEHIASAAKEAVKVRFDKLKQAEKQKDKSIEAGRQYVAAYVEYVHFVEGLHNTVIGGQVSHEHAASTEEH